LAKSIVKSTNISRGEGRGGVLARNISKSRQISTWEREEEVFLSRISVSQDKYLKGEG
jgi:hypothetical protein